jgi:hypothetical protein
MPASTTAAASASESPCTMLAVREREEEGCMFNYDSPVLIAPGASCARASLLVRELCLSSWMRSPATSSSVVPAVRQDAICSPISSSYSAGRASPFFLRQPQGEDKARGRDLQLLPRSILLCFFYRTSISPRSVRIVQDFISTCGSALRLARDVQVSRSHLNDPTAASMTCSYMHV